MSKKHISPQRHREQSVVCCELYVVCSPHCLLELIGFIGLLGVALAGWDDWLQLTTNHKQQTAPSISGWNRTTANKQASTGNRQLTTINEQQTTDDGLIGLLFSIPVMRDLKAFFKRVFRIKAEKRSGPVNVGNGFSNVAGPGGLIFRFCRYTGQAADHFPEIFDTNKTARTHIEKLTDGTLGHCGTQICPDHVLDKNKIPVLTSVAVNNRRLPGGSLC